MLSDRDLQPCYEIAVNPTDAYLLTQNSDKAWRRMRFRARSRLVPRARISILAAAYAWIYLTFVSSTIHTAKTPQ
jgi:hypothetical protein